MNKTKYCWHCGEEIDMESVMCPECGISQTYNSPLTLTKVIRGIITIFGLFALLSAIGSFTSGAIILSLIYICIASLTIIPLTELIMEKTNTHIPLIIRIAAVLILLMISGAMIQ